jgi:dUTP pyrophosphatase
MKIRVIHKSEHQLPAYSTLLSAGMDIRSTDINQEIVLIPMESVIVEAGSFLEIPVGYEARKRPGSGFY